jgi:hypothetical protein
MNKKDIEDNYEILEYDDIQKNYNSIKRITETNMHKFLKNKYYNYESDSILLFKTKTYVQNNFKSYNHDIDSVWKQFKVDCPRMSIFINNKIINDSDNFKKELDVLKNYNIRINKINYKLIDALAMLATQSSFAFPYTFLHTVQTKFDNDVHVLNMTSNRRICIDIDLNIKDYNQIKITIETDFGFMDINKNKLLSKINSTLILELILDTNNKEATFLKNSIFLTKDYEFLQ